MIIINHELENWRFNDIMKIAHVCVEYKKLTFLIWWRFNNATFVMSFFVNLLFLYFLHFL